MNLESIVVNVAFLRCTSPYYNLNPSCLPLFLMYIQTYLGIFFMSIEL